MPTARVRTVQRSTCSYVGRGLPDAPYALRWANAEITIVHCVGGMLDVHFWQIPTACRQADTWVNVANLRVILSQERAVFNAVSRMKGELKKECFL